MPINSDINQISIWLNENLTVENSIVPHSDPIPAVTSKGIYFWFIHPDGYQALSNYVIIEPIQPRYSKNIVGTDYDLVYIGTAGTGKKGNSNLSDRLKWHIEQQHTTNATCSGTLSTLRAGLGALLSEDLIVPNTEELVNQLLQIYFKVYWIEYSDDKAEIDNDEAILINILKPLLNIKGNANALANANSNPTQIYKNRRVEIYINTKDRLGCKGENPITREKNNPNDDTPLYSHQVIVKSEDGCIEYFVLKGQHIGEVTRGVEGLPLGKSKIKIYDSSNVNTEFTQWRRVTGNNKDHNAQNIYTYFDNTSSGDGPPRYIVIDDWMEANNISEITIQVCPIIEKSSYLGISPSKTTKINAKMSINQEELKLSENFNVVMMCSKSKQDNSDLIFDNNPIAFKAISNRNINQFKPDDKVTLNENYTWRNFVSDNQHQAIIPFRAYELYRNNSYQYLFQAFNRRMFIISAGWGIINAEFRLPNYDITFSENPDAETLRNDYDPDFHDYNQLIGVTEEDDIVFIPNTVMVSTAVRRKRRDAFDDLTI